MPRFNNLLRTLTHQLDSPPKVTASALPIRLTVSLELARVEEVIDEPKDGASLSSFGAKLSRLRDELL